TAEEVEALTGRPVTDITPDGELARRHPVVQIAHDVKIGTAPKRVRGVLAAVLALLPGFRRVGVGCHQRHEAARARACPGLGVGPFGGPDGRGSNEWYRECDVLVILGTPRVPPAAVRTELLRLGKLEAAGLDERGAGWGRVEWDGAGTNGRRAR